jgi:3-oxoacyl-[acyl-carrier-protein] synthase III
MNPVYITRLSKFFPNEPVSNDEMEKVLGMVAGKPSRARSITLRNNGIKNRYYAIKDGKVTHSNAEMATLAVKGLFDEKHPLKKLDLLAAGTTSPEQLLPSHAAMIHGELGDHPIEIMSASGACASSIQALKYAYMAIGSGLSKMAAAVGSERCSGWTKASRYKKEADSWQDMDKNPYIAFEKDFLRWMLSDGAGAALLEDKPNDDGISLKIDWLEIISYANELETCMYAGATKNDDASLTSWNDMESSQWGDESVFAYKQDTRLLGDNIVPRGGLFLKELMEKRGIVADDIDYYLPHMSSEFFKKQIQEYHVKLGLELPAEKWFYNLPKVGNVGSASPYLMMEELFHSGRLKKGEHILVMVPESARFTYAYIYLTVV